MTRYDGMQLLGMRSGTIYNIHNIHNNNNKTTTNTMRTMTGRTSTRGRQELRSERRDHARRPMRHGAFEGDVRRESAHQEPRDVLCAAIAASGRVLPVRRICVRACRTLCWRSAHSDRGAPVVPQSTEYMPDTRADDALCATARVLDMYTHTYIWLSLSGREGGSEGVASSSRR